jgi:cystathionine gamma-synthase
MRDSAAPMPDESPTPASRRRPGANGAGLPAALGAPIPDDPHAISVCLPTWADVIGYEEGEQRVRAALRAGYPRFVVNGEVARLHQALAGAGGHALAFASAGAARRAAGHVDRRGGRAELLADAAGRCHWLRLADESSLAAAREIWRYAGEGVSSRGALALAAGRPLAGPAGDPARAEIRQRLAAGHGVDGSQVRLFASGMAAVAAVHRALCARRPAAGSVQVDFPYVDVLRIQRSLGGGAVRCLRPGPALRDELAAALAAGFTAGAYFETPANPLLGCADLAALAPACRAAGVPVVADDTVASSHNVALLPHADLVTTSLSKWFNGRCNLLAGAVILNPDSPWQAEFASLLDDDDPAPLGDDDAAELAANSRGFAARMEEVNANGSSVAAFLRAHPAVALVHFPDQNPAYERLRRPAGGPGGLLSFRLHGGEAAAAAFYDAAELAKGPSLGADFSLLCPYTLLAHYDELDAAAAWGATRDLLRLSVGREPAADLLERLNRALEHTKSTES